MIVSPRFVGLSLLPQTSVTIPGIEADHMSLPEAPDSRAGPLRRPLYEPVSEADAAASVHLAPVPARAQGRHVWASRDQAAAVAVDHVSVRLAADGVEVALAGELDLAIAPAIFRTVRDLRAAGHNRIINTLDAVTFMDASILGVLIVARRDATTSGGSLELTAHPLCDRLLKITGMTNVFTIAGR